jgi:hypothetical protein
MDCTDAYREALTRDYEATASSAPTRRPASAPGQRQGAEAVRPRTDPGRSELADRAAAAGPGAVAGSGPATAPDTDATAVNGRR